MVSTRHSRPNSSLRRSVDLGNAQGRDAVTPNRWALCINTHKTTSRGVWHKIHPDWVGHTLCARIIMPSWRQEKNFPLMDDSVTNKVCEQCYRKDRTP
jgi:hypothetical protein